jgi:hypothetical protein
MSDPVLLVKEVRYESERAIQKKKGYLRESFTIFFK